MFLLLFPSFESNILVANSSIPYSSLLGILPLNLLDSMYYGIKGA